MTDTDQGPEVAQIGAQPQECTITIPGRPYPKSRPRFARTGRTYAKPADVVAEHRTAMFLRSVIREPLTGNVAVRCVFYLPDRKRVDGDNLLKHVLDAGIGVIFADDSQATSLTAILELDRTNPRTEITISGHVSTLVRH